MQMVVAHCGRCAERVVFGDEITDGGRDDLEKITKVIWDDPFVILANLTLEVSQLFSRELTRYIEETEEIAMSGLKEGPLPHNDRFGCPLSESKLDIDSGSWEKKETRLLTPKLWFLDAEAIEYCQLTLEYKGEMQQDCILR
ncbi:ATP-dependent zinc metalloprotease FTSH 12, chloroplastic [Vitis vinifera]|uniref:ATP-dependent zinc metalloprotease FTSH 12, chloroplastic n=1 Tax=Vitis vinifera TaxID=29760 RepID=A0A438F496_VITVI|nr:ATP-dependent zinc metalloprotease FTSH 12, chloroplastic [Vitis vinifera]